MLFSFERPGRGVAAVNLSPDLENCTVGQTNEHLHREAALGPALDEKLITVKI
jgi:hypothetical protein